MNASIIVPTYNRKNQLKQCLEHLQQLDYPKEKHEIIIINDISGDGTKELLEQKKEEIPNLKSINREGKNGIGSARNTGLQKAQGEYIFFTDDDCIVPQTWIQQHFEKREEHNVDVVNGVQYPVEMNWIEAYKVASHWQHYQQTRILADPRTIESIKTNNLSLKKEILDDVGYFNEKLERAEDTELGKRILKAGYTAVTDPSLKVEHLRNDSLKEHVVTQYKLGKSLKILEQLHEPIQNNRIQENYIIKAWKQYIDMTPLYQVWIFPILAVMSTLSRRIGQV